MAAAVCDRLKLVKRLLTALNGKESAHARASASQSVVMQELLSRTCLSLDEGVEIAEIVAEVPWHSEDHQSHVLAALTYRHRVQASHPSAAAVQQPTRRPMQDYTAIVNYLKKISVGDNAL